MKRIIQPLVLIAVIIAASGCTTLEVGDAKITSLFSKKTIKSIDYSGIGTNGVTHKLKVQGYSGDQVEALGVVAEGVAKGLKGTP